jgi:UDP-glucose 4-epimerase
LEQLVRQVDQIYHLAAVVGVKYVVEDRLGCITTNIEGTQNVLRAALEHAVRTVVASSSEVYGKSTDVPLRESGDRLLGPTVVSRWSYADAKAIDEHLALAYGALGLPVTVVRYFNAFGPRMDPRGYGSVVARFIVQALAGEPITIYDDGSQTRCFTYVTDTVDGTIEAGTRPAAAGQVINIGSDHEVSIEQLAKRVRRLALSDSEIVHVASSAVYGPTFEEPRRRVPDIGRARDLLGFEAKVPLEEGLQLAIDWFRARELRA